MKKELTNISEKSLMELEDIVNEEMLTTEDVNNMLEHTDKGRTKVHMKSIWTFIISRKRNVKRKCRNWSRKKKI